MRRSKLWVAILGLAIIAIGAVKLRFKVPQVVAAVCGIDYCDVNCGDSCGACGSCEGISDCPSTNQCIIDYDWDDAACCCGVVGSHVETLSPLCIGDGAPEPTATPTPCPAGVKDPAVTPDSPENNDAFSSDASVIKLMSDFIFRTLDGTRIREVWVWDRTQYPAANYIQLCRRGGNPADGSYSCDLRRSSDPKINLEPGHAYRWYSVGINECYSAKSDKRNFSLEAPTPTPTPTPTPITVAGRVFLDNEQDAGGDLNGKCTDPLTPGEPIRPGNNSLVRIKQGDLTDKVSPDGDYRIKKVVPADNQRIGLESISPQYHCTCPAGCAYGSAAVLSANSNDWNFYVVSVPPRWWQAFGGDVHAQTGFSSSAPAGSSVMVDQTSLITSPHGVASRLLGNSFTFPEGGTLSVLPIWDLADVLASASWRYGYQAMYARAGRPTTNPSPSDGTAPPSADAMYQLTGDYAISGAGWNGLTGWRVIFVDGKVTINDKIKLTPNAFLAIIASGNIAVDPAVGRNTPLASFSDPDAQSQLQGVFLADGSFKGGTDGLGADKQLVIYGTVAADANLDGTGSVITQRDLGPDNDKPAVAFIWNPNLVINAPEEIGDAITDWRTSAP